MNVWTPRHLRIVAYEYKLATQRQTCELGLMIVISVVTLYQRYLVNTFELSLELA